MRGYVARFYTSFVDTFMSDDTATAATIPRKVSGTQLRYVQLAVVLQAEVEYEGNGVVLRSKPVLYGRRYYFGLSRVTRVGFADLPPEKREAWKRYLEFTQKFNVFVELEDGSLYPVEDDAVVVLPQSKT